MTTYLFTKKPVRSMMAALLCSSVLLTGCGTTGGGNPLSTLTGGGQYNDVADPCNDFREPLRASRDYFAQTIVQNVIAGAAVGAATGLLTGILKGGSRADLARTTLIGAGIGGLGGLAAGYLKAKQQEAADQATLEAAIRGDAGADNTRLRTFAQAMDAIDVCRNQQMDTLEDQVISGRIDQATFNRQVAAVESQVATDGDLIESVLGKAFERSDAYAGAYAQTTGTTSEILLAPVQTYQPTVVTRTVPYSPPPPVYYSAPVARYDTVAAPQPVAPAPSYEAVAIPQYEMASPIQTVPQSAPQPVLQSVPQALPRSEPVTPVPSQYEVAALPQSAPAVPAVRASTPINDEAEYDARKAARLAQERQRVVADRQSRQIVQATATIDQNSQGNQSSEFTSFAANIKGLKKVNGVRSSSTENRLASLRNMSSLAPDSVQT